MRPIMQSSLSALLILLLSITITSEAKFVPNVRNSFNGFLESQTRFFVIDGYDGLTSGGISRGPNDELLVASDVLDFGTQVIFTPKRPNKPGVVNITESTPFNMRFFLEDGNTLWKVEGYPGPGPFYLSSKGVEGEATTWFQINKTNYYNYVLVFCPIEDDETSCIPVGVVEVDGKKVLGLVTPPTNFRIVFVLDEEPLATSTAM